MGEIAAAKEGNQRPTTTTTAKPVAPAVPAPGADARPRVETNGKQVKRKHFFEKFGTLLKQRSDAFLLHVNNPVPPVLGEESDSPGGPTSSGQPGNRKASSSNTRPTPGTATSSNQQIIRSSAAGEENNMEELYEKILHEVKQGNIVDRQKKLTQKALFAYIQEVFGVDEAKHAELEQRVDTMLAQDIFLRVEIIEAKLKPTPAPEVLPNAFAIVYLQEKPRELHRTAAIANTLNPGWGQQFPVAVKQDTKETLLIEVYNNANNPNKMYRMIRIAKKYVRSLFMPVASQCKLIGRASIPLESITSTGLVSWYNLSKKKKPDPQGTIKVKFFFTSKLEKSTAKREYEQMLRYILQYELRSSSVARYWWAGELTTEGDSILVQYCKCANLTPAEQTVIRWFVYTQIHLTHPLSISLLEGMLDKLSAGYDTGLASDDERTRFWEGVRRILPSCLSIVMKMRKRIAGDKDIVKTITSILHLLSKAEQLATKKGIVLFDEATVRSIKQQALDCTKHSTMKDAVVLAVQLGARTWFETLLASAIEGTLSNEEKLRSLIKFVQMLQSDLLRAKTYYDSVFKEVMGIDYSREICIQHETRIVSHLRPIVQTICNGFKKITLKMEQLDRRAEMESLDMSSTLFELYLVLKLFLQQTDTVVQSAHNPYLVEFHQWFRGGVVYYLDVFAIKTFSRVVTVLEEDELKQVQLTTGADQSPDTVRKYTASTGEILEIVAQIKIFWQQLGWPDKDELKKFLKRSIGDICSCCIFYADRLLVKLKTMDASTATTDTVVNGAPLATLDRSLVVLSNVSILTDTLIRLPDELGYSRSRDSASSGNSSGGSENGRKTSLELLLADDMLPIQSLSSWRERCLQYITEHVSLTTTNLLTACVDGGLPGSTSNGTGFFSNKSAQSPAENVVRLKHWIEQSASRLGMELSQDDLRSVEQKLWTAVEAKLTELIKKLLEKKDSLATFQRLNGCYTLLTLHYFHTLSDTISSSTIGERLDIFSCSTTELLHRYYLERLRQQDELEEPECGLLTVRCWFQPDGLQVKILRADQLQLPKDYKHSCDSYVKINVIPPDRFGPPPLPELKTKTKSKNFSPVYNESFTLKLNPVQHSLKDVLLMMNVKVSELLGLNQKHIGECFVPLQKVPILTDASMAHEVQPITLPLSLPFTIESFSVAALETRTNDKVASQFLKKLKQKMGVAPYTMSTLSL